MDDALYYKPLVDDLIIALEQQNVTILDFGDRYRLSTTVVDFDGHAHFIWYVHKNLSEIKLHHIFVGDTFKLVPISICGELIHKSIEYAVLDKLKY